MKKIEDLNYYELLEVSHMATSQEIHKAYERVRRVYEPNSVALYSLFSPEETEAIHQRIEEAYRTLLYEDNRRRYDSLLRERNELPEPPQSYPKYQPRPVQPDFALPAENRSTAGPGAQQPAPPAPDSSHQETVSPMSQLVGEFTGDAIKTLREEKGLTVRNIADTTKIGTRYLEFIEAETFQKLPARPYLRGFLMIYAKALGCDAVRMSSDYIKRYDAAMNPAKK